MKKRIIYLSLILFVFISCNENNEQKNNENTNHDTSTEDSTKYKNKDQKKESDLASVTKNYLGEYVCCPNKKERDIITIKCDNTKPSRYQLAIENNKLVLTFFFWQDAFSSIIDKFSFEGDTLILNYQYAGNPSVFKISEMNNYLFDNTNDIESNGWIHNPTENGWTVEDCDVNEDI